MQAVTLSQEQLMGLLHLLKESLSFFDKKCYPKVTFFNDWCLYQHIRAFNIPRMAGKRRFHANIGVLLDVLEPYIPFRLTEENFDLFIEAAMYQNDEPDPQFSHKAKMDFVVALRAINHPQQWIQALSVCEAIRALKEELSVPQVF